MRNRYYRPEVQTTREWLKGQAELAAELAAYLLFIAVVVGLLVGTQ